MMKKIYISNYSANERLAEAYTDRLAAENVSLVLAKGTAGDATALKESDALLVFLGEGQSLRTVKQDVNLALDRKLPVFAVLFGEPEVDRGLEVQLGLATKIRAADGEPADDGSAEPAPDGPEELAAAIRAFAAAEPEKKKKTGLVIAIAAAVLALLIGGFILFTRPNVPPEDPPADPAPPIPEHVETEDALLAGLVAAGLDTDGDGYIQESELAAAMTLDLAGRGITDVAPLAKATELTELDLSNNAVASCAPLLALKNLTKLDLSGNPLEDASNLAFMTWVTDLKYDGGTK